MTQTPRATATIAHILKGIDFPCTRAGIIKYARRQGAEAASLQLLKELPVQRYASMADVFVGVGVADRKYYEDKPDEGQAEPVAVEAGTKARESQPEPAPQPEAQSQPQPRLQPRPQPEVQPQPEPRQAKARHRFAETPPQSNPESLLMPMLWFWPMVTIRLSLSSIELMRRMMTAYGWPPH